MTWPAGGRAPASYGHIVQRLNGRVALVTGGGRGIGRAIAARLLDEGAAVGIIEVDGAAGEDARDELAARGRIHLEVADVADDAAVGRAVGAVASWGGRLDLAINNAAITPEQRVPVDELDLDRWRRSLDVNLTGPLLVVRHALPHLRQTTGVIVNITSTRAAMSEPNTEPYSATKGGLTALTHALAISLGPDVRVNAIAPGWIETQSWETRDRRGEPELRPVDHAQHPAGRVGRPEDVAGLVVYLASDEAAFVTGQVFTIDGGMTRKMIYAD